MNNLLRQGTSLHNVTKIFNVALRRSIIYFNGVFECFSDVDCALRYWNNVILTSYFVFNVSNIFSSDINTNENDSKWFKFKIHTVYSICSFFIQSQGCIYPVGLWDSRSFRKKSRSSQKGAGFIPHFEKSRTTSNRVRNSVFWAKLKIPQKHAKSRSFLSEVRDFPHFTEFADTALQSRSTSYQVGD